MNAVAQLTAAAVVIVSGVGLLVVATGGPTDRPFAGQAEPDPEAVIAKVSGQAFGDFTGALTSTHTDAGWVYVDQAAAGLFMADDPRLKGRFESLFDWIDFEPELDAGVAAISMETTISNEDGAWQGTLTGIRYADEGFGDQHLAGALAGSGTYDGLTAYLLLESDGGVHTFEGVIFPGDMPE